MAALNGVRLRAGCFCNPGCCAGWLGLTAEAMVANYRAGRVCWDDTDIVDGAQHSIRYRQKGVVPKSDLSAAICTHACQNHICLCSRSFYVIVSGSCGSSKSLVGDGHESDSDLAS